MSQLFKVTAFIPDMGSYTTTAHAGGFETLEENALWDINSARRHDGLLELSLASLRRYRAKGQIKFAPIN